MNRLFQSGDVARARMSVYFCTLSKHTKLDIKFCKTLYIISAIKGRGLPYGIIHNVVLLLNRLQICTGERKTPNLVSQIQRNFLLKDIFEQFVRNFFLINSEFILRVC